MSQQKIKMIREYVQKGDVFLRSADSFKCCEDFTTYEVGNIFYDFHNDFECEYIIMKDNELSLRFKNLLNDVYVSLSFHDAEMKAFTFLNDNRVKNLTLDLIYRGRCEMDGEMIEFLSGKGYFYIDFLEGQKFEFSASSVNIHEEFLSGD